MAFWFSRMVGGGEGGEMVMMMMMNKVLPRK
jgi:hypothetical protein